MRVRTSSFSLFFVLAFSLGAMAARGALGGERELALCCCCAVLLWAARRGLGGKGEGGARRALWVLKGVCVRVCV